jgi:glutamate 5-kinase
VPERPIGTLSKSVVQMMYRGFESLPFRQKAMIMKKKLILKIGTSTLTGDTDRISYAKIEDIARQIMQLRDQFDFVIVSSGAIAAARQFTKLDFNTSVDNKQALSAIGQPQLIRIYDEVFKSFGLHVAQCLITYRDVEHTGSRRNIQNTVETLHKSGYIPIFNENDTVSTDEIVFGDNDKLSSMVATLTEAHLLILASDIDGLFTKNPQLHDDAELISEVTNLADVEGFAEEKKVSQGTGGMTSKLMAAQRCMEKGVEMWIVNGGGANFVVDALNGKIPFTRFRV